MTHNAYTKLHAQYGDAETFWDVSFNNDHLAYAETKTNDIRHISVFIDPDTGKISLNNGYTPGSAPFEDENALFDNFKDAIVEALASSIRNKTPEYSKFLDASSADRDRRAAALEKLNSRIRDQLEDDEA